MTTGSACWQPTCSQWIQAQRAALTTSNTGASRSVSLIIHEQCVNLYLGCRSGRTHDHRECRLTAHMSPVDPDKAGLAIKNPPKKTRPIKPKKKRLKNPPQSGFFGFYWVFFKTDLYFLCKSHYFSNKNLCCNEYETLILIPVYIILCSNLISHAVVVTLICRIRLTKRSMFFLLKSLPHFKKI
jgi:hypothetical protein